MMKFQRQLFAALAVSMLAAPVGSATWYAFGTYEPDTSYDVEGAYMQTDPDVTPSGRNLYFNAYQSEYLTGTNANSGLLGSRIQVAGAQQWQVLMGAWKDCNGDSYVGFAESAIVVYQTALLLDASICPPGGLHNDGQWVYEYIPVGFQQGETTPSAHPAQIVDKDSRVWADIGLPGDGAAGTCPIVPLPHGTTAGTGWALRYADCFTGKQITGSVNKVDSDGSLGLRFEDQNNPHQSKSLLNQHFPESLFGNPETGETGALQLDSEEDGGSEEAAFTTWDCSDRLVEVKDPTGLAPRTIVVNDPTFNGQNGALAGNYGKLDENLTDEDGNYAWVARPAPSVNDPADSYADGINGTFRGFHTGGNEDFDSSAYGGTCKQTGNDEDGDNTYSGLHQEAFFYADGDHEGNTQVVAKNKADVRFTYFNGGEVEGAQAELFGPRYPGAPVVTPTGSYLFLPGWSANVVYVTQPQSISRQTLSPSPAAYWTFYGKVGPATLDAGWKPAGGTGRYGAETCGANTEGVHNGWQCDSALWYRDSTGKDIASPLGWDVRVHSPYQFRDVDCNDGQLVRGIGLRASLTDFSGGDRLSCSDA